MLVLGYAGGSHVTPMLIGISQLASAYFFIHFLIILPLISKFERPLPLPDSISTSVLHGERRESAPVGVAPKPSTAAE